MKISSRELANVIREAIEESGRNGRLDNYYNKVELFNDPKLKSGKDWGNERGNFAVKRGGNVYYVGTTTSVSLYCYCRNESGEWCVLANQRGYGAPTSKGLWNTPCGYQDMGEQLEDSAIREAFEETGVVVPRDKVEFMGLRSGGKNNTARFAAVLDGTVNDYPIDISHCEEGEVIKAAWIPLSKLNTVSWAFNQDKKIIPQAETSLRGIDGFGEKNVDEMIDEMRSLLGRNARLLSLFNGIINQLR